MTRYYVRYQPTNGERENFTAFDAMSMRAVWIVDHAQIVTVLATWEANEPSAGVTHYAPMTAANDGADMQTALCGASMHWRDHSALPECDECERQLAAQIRRVIETVLDEATA